MKLIQNRPKNMHNTLWHMKKSRKRAGRSLCQSMEELLRAIRKYNTRYNNISRKVLGFKSPNEVLKEYKENQ